MQCTCSMPRPANGSLAPDRKRHSMTKTVVVTGAGSGIGRAVATLLADRGWRVVVTDINADAAAQVSQSLARDAGQQHESAKLNVSSSYEATAIADDVADRLGLQAWVSNA